MASSAQAAEAWPRGLRELADILGEEYALALAARFGGVPYYLPSSPTPHHAFAAVLPPAAFAALCASWLAGTYVTIPRGPTRKSLTPDILRMLAEGKSQRAIALALGVGVSYVGKVCRRQRAACASAVSLPPSASRPSSSAARRPVSGQALLPGLHCMKD